MMIPNDQLPGEVGGFLRHTQIARPRSIVRGILLLPTDITQ